MPTESGYAIDDLLFALIGLRQLENPPSDAGKSGNDYWLADGQPRVLKWNWSWFDDPKAAWAAVRHRNWLIAELGLKVVGHGHEFVAIPGPLTTSMDILVSEITPQMAENSPNRNLKALTSPDHSDYQRSFTTALTIGLLTGRTRDADVVVVGGGLRRRTRVIPPHRETGALQMDLEIYIPACAIAEDGALVAVPDRLRSLQLGLAVTRGGNALGAKGEALNLAGLRFNASVPFHPGQETTFDPPQVQAQMKGMLQDGKEQDWQSITNGSWQELVGELFAVPGAEDLLKAPLGPITVEQISHDRFLDVMKRGFAPIKEGLRESRANAKATAAYLRKWSKSAASLEERVTTGGEKKPEIPSLGTVADYFSTLGFITKTVGGEYELNKKLQELDFWDVVNALANDLDGFPLFVLGLTEKEKAKDRGQGDGTKDEAAPKYEELRAAAQLAAVSDENDPRKHFFGLRGLAYNIRLKRGSGTKNQTQAEILVHLGKWFSGETGDDNWFRRLLPTHPGSQTKPVTGQPGIGLYPLSMALSAQESDAHATFEQEWRADLISLGVDIKSAADEGLFSASHFRVGGVELRLLLALEFPRAASGPILVWGIAVKLTGMRISLVKREEAKTEEDEILDAVQKMFAEAEAEAEGKKEKPLPATRLQRTKADEKTEKAGFALSTGYLSPLEGKKNGSFDLQLYDAKGARGKVAWLPVNRRKGPLYLKNIGVALKDVDGQKRKMRVLFTGGLRFASFELGLIGAGVSFPLNNPAAIAFEMQGLDLSFKADPAVVSGSFLKAGDQYAGAVRVELPAFSISAMGAYGKLAGGDTALFIYGALSAAEGGGFGNAVIKITGLALGLGINYRVTVPDVRDVADFSLVKIVMGEGELAKTSSGTYARDIRRELGKPVDRPDKILGQMQDDLKPAAGYYFGAIGLRFTLLETIDCFALAVLQVGEELAFTLLGLARLKLPKGKGGKSDTKAICYAELQLVATFKPVEGSLKVQAVLSDNSWVLSQDCKLTGGFALCIWTGGEHKGDFVVTLGGYHPRFRRPAHYPMVDRLGIRWQITSGLLVKGEMYCAITPSAIMAGGRLEASYRSGRVAAWFTAYADLLMEWNPVHYEIDVGISVRAEADLFFFTLRVTVGAQVHLWGPPFGGMARVELGPISVPIEFGARRDEARPKRIQTWARFGRNFLDQIELDAAGKIGKADPDETLATGKWRVPTGAETVVSGPVICQPNLGRGRLTRPGATENGKADGYWTVRGDELELSASTAVPVTQLKVGKVKTNSPPVGVQDLEHSGKALSVDEPLEVEADKEMVKTGARVGVRPMGINSLNSQLSVTLVREDVEDPAVDLAGWTFEEETSALPAALWDSEAPDLGAGPREPSAKLIPGCITGLKRFKPPPGKIRGNIGPISADKLTPDPLKEREVRRSPEKSQPATQAQERPDVEKRMKDTAERRGQIALALAAAGFELPVLEEPRPDPQDVRFRALYAEPLAGAVAAVDDQITDDR